jgi:hypothetical protein
MAEYGSTNTAGIEKSLDKLLEIADKQLKSALILERYTRWLIALTIILALDVFYRVAMDFCHVHN